MISLFRCIILLVYAYKIIANILDIDIISQYFTRYKKSKCILLLLPYIEDRCKKHDKMDTVRTSSKVFQWQSSILGSLKQISVKREPRKHSHHDRATEFQTFVDTPTTIATKLMVLFDLYSHPIWRTLSPDLGEVLEDCARVLEDALSPHPLEKRRILQVLLPSFSINTCYWKYHLNYLLLYIIFVRVKFFSWLNNKNYYYQDTIKVYIKLIKLVSFPT